MYKRQVEPQERERKIRTLLGFAQRSGKLVSGDDLVLAYVKKGRAKLVIAAQDAAWNTKKEFYHIITKTSVPWYPWGEKAAIGWAIGKSPRALVALTDEGFAAALAELLQQQPLGKKEEWLNG